MSAFGDAGSGPASGAAPDRRRADPRRNDALAAADRLRRARHRTLERLRSGEADLPGVLDEADRDALVGPIKIVALVEAVPGVGKVGARRALAEVGVATDRAAAQVSAEDREALLHALVTRAARA